MEESIQTVVLQSIRRDNSRGYRVQDHNHIHHAIGQHWSTPPIFLIGAGDGGVMWARHHIPWYPHHIGFPIERRRPLSLHGLASFLFASATILGMGVNLTVNRPFFLGLILGHVFVSGFWVVFDCYGRDGQPVPIFKGEVREAAIGNEWNACVRSNAIGIGHGVWEYVCSFG